MDSSKRLRPSPSQIELVSPIRRSGGSCDKHLYDSSACHGFLPSIYGLNRTPSNESLLPQFRSVKILAKDMQVRVKKKQQHLRQLQKHSSKQSIESLKIQQQEALFSVRMAVENKQHEMSDMQRRAHSLAKQSKQRINKLLEEDKLLLSAAFNRPQRLRSDQLQFQDINLVPFTNRHPPILTKEASLKHSTVVTAAATTASRSPLHIISATKSTQVQDASFEFSERLPSFLSFDSQDRLNTLDDDMENQCATAASAIQKYLKPQVVVPPLKSRQPSSHVLSQINRESCDKKMPSSTSKVIVVDMKQLIQKHLQDNKNLSEYDYDNTGSCIYSAASFSQYTADLPSRYSNQPK